MKLLKRRNQARMKMELQSFNTSKHSKCSICEIPGQKDEKNGLLSNSLLERWIYSSQ